MIVGNWQAKEIVLEEEEVKDELNKVDSIFYVHQFYFSSDELSAQLILKSPSGETEELKCAFKIYEDLEKFDKPILVCKNMCDEGYRMVFAIDYLNKRYLGLSLLEEHSSDDLPIMSPVLKFHRTAGPPENIED